MPNRSYTSDTGDLASVSTKGITFELDGVTFELDGEFDEMDMQDLAADLMDSSDSWGDLRALGASGQFMQAIMGRECYAALRRHRKEHRTPLPVIAQIVQDLVEDLTARDPQKPSASPPGRPGPAGRSSAGGSPSPASPRREKAITRRPPEKVDPEGIIPRDMPAGDILTAEAPGQQQEEEGGARTRRVINLGDATRTRVEPLDETG